MAAGAGARPAPRWLKALAEPLSAAQLRRLEEHRYSAAGVSLLEPPLQLFWAWLLQWVPLWLAPNTITLLGLAVNLLTTLVLISYCPAATEEVGPAPRRRRSDPQLLSPGAPRRSAAPGAPLEEPRERGDPARRGLPGPRTLPPPPRRFRPETPPCRLEAVALLLQPRVHPGPPRRRRRGCQGHCEPGACLLGLHPIQRQAMGGGQAVGNFLH